MSSENLAVVFIGFDGYSDLWDDCMTLYNHFWKDRPYQTYFVNNQKEVSYENITTLNAGVDAEWSRKVQCALEATTEKYICLLLEDFYVGAQINTSEIVSTIDFMEKEQLRYFKLVNMSRMVANRDPHYKDKEYLHVIPQSDEYGISLQAAIWERSFLEQLVGNENYNAWVFEFNQVREAQGKSDEPFPGCVFDERNIFNLKHGVVQGKYLPDTIQYFKDIQLPLNVQREVMTKWDYFKLKFRSRIKYAIPKSCRKPVKRLAEKMGMTFVSTLRDK